MFVLNIYFNIANKYTNNFKENGQMKQKITGTGVTNIYDYTVDSGLKGNEREERFQSIAKIIGKSRSAVYNKLRKEIFSKAEQVVLFQEINGYLGSEQELESFFKKEAVTEFEADA